MTNRVKILNNRFIIKYKSLLNIFNVTNSINTLNSYFSAEYKYFLGAPSVIIIINR